MIRFGPSGNCTRFYEEGYTKSVEAPKWLSEQGLSAYEFSFGRGINVSDETATQIGKEAAKYDVQVSVHAPYYVNFANPSDEMAEKSYGYVLRSCKKLPFFGGERVVFHPSTVGKMTRKEAVDLTISRLRILAEKIYAEKLDNFLFCPETMGKINQIGDLYEVVEMCKLAPFFVPTVDFGHLNARTYGSIRTEEDYERMIAHIIDNLGFDKADKMHIHFSKIEYSQGGEVRHLTFEDKVFGPEFEPLAAVLKKYKLNPVCICESAGTQTDDALTMKRIYESLQIGGASI